MEVRTEYHAEQQFNQFWELADKSSTIEAKADYMGKFLHALESGKSDFADHNAVWLKTPNNALESNIEAVRTLCGRLEQIRGMDPASFQYNTAIEQITKQEQGEAGQMLAVIDGCYWLKNAPICWGWIGAMVIFAEFLMFVVFILIVIA